MRPCNPKKCKNRKPQLTEYIGPVKIVLLDPVPTCIDKRACGAACLGFATLLIGAAFMTCVVASVIFADNICVALHFIMCSTGFQLYMPIGMMGINPLFGSTNPMKIKDRKKEHLLTETMAFICIILGCVCAVCAFRTMESKATTNLTKLNQTNTTTTPKYNASTLGGTTPRGKAPPTRPPRTRPTQTTKRRRITTTTAPKPKRKTLQDVFLKSVHSIAGIVSVLLTVMAVLTGPFAFFDRKGVLSCLMKGLHVFFTVPAFVSSSFCFVTGVLKIHPNKMVTKEATPIVLALCFVYTLIVIIGPLMKCFRKFK